MSAVGQTGARTNKNLIYWVVIILVLGSLVSAAIIFDPGRARLKLVASNADREIVGCLYGDPKDASRRYLPVVFDKSDGGLRILTGDLKETLAKIGSPSKLLSINIKKDPISGSHDTSTTTLRPSLKVTQAMFLFSIRLKNSTQFFLTTTSILRKLFMWRHTQTQ